MALCNAFPINDKNAQNFAINKLKNPILAIGKYIFSTIQYLIYSSKFRNVFSILSHFYKKKMYVLTTLSNKRRDIIENTF